MRTAKLTYPIFEDIVHKVYHIGPEEGSMEQGTDVRIYPFHRERSE